MCRAEPRTPTFFRAVAALPYARHRENATHAERRATRYANHHEERAWRLQLGGNRRQYLDDGDRPAEIARIQKIIAGTCSKDPKTPATQQAAADRLHTARSQGCADARERLLMAEKPSPATPKIMSNTSVRRSRKIAQPSR